MNAINNLDKIIYFILEYNYKYQFENINKNKIQLELIVISPYLRIELINHDNRLSVVNVTNFDCDNCKNQIAGIDCLTSSFLPENIKKAISNMEKEGSKSQVVDLPDGSKGLMVDKSDIDSLSEKDIDDIVDNLLDGINKANGNRSKE